MSLTHPAENHDDDGNIVPFNHLWLHLNEARGKAHRLSADQLAAELEAVAARHERTTSRHWDKAIIEEGALRIQRMALYLREMSRVLDGQV